MQLTQSERKLIGMETSYRVQRNCCTIFSVFCVLPLFFGIGYTILGLLRFRDHIDILMRVMLEADWGSLWGSLFPMLTILLVFCFFAYRAQSKLTLIAHLKHHLETERSEPVAAPTGGPTRLGNLAPEGPPSVS